MTSQYIRYPASSGGVQTYATFASLPATAADGTLALTLDTDTLYVFNVGSMMWLAIGAPGLALAIGTIDGIAASANGAVLSTDNLYMQSATASFPGLVNTGTQTFAGNKTFTGTIGASNLSGTNTGDVTLAAFGSTPSANGASLSGQVLTLQPADATHPGGITTGSQTIAGNKTLSGTTNLSALTASLPLQLDGSKNITAAAINLSTASVTGILPSNHGGSSTVINSLYVDLNRTDTYTPNGSVSLPFKTIMAAVNQVIANGDNASVPYLINVASGDYAENIDLNNNSLVNLTFVSNGAATISPGGGNSFFATTNDNLNLLSVSGFIINNPIVFTGATNGNQQFQGGAGFKGCLINATATILLTNTGYYEFDDCDIVADMTATNTNEILVFGGPGWQGNNYILITDNGANKPNGFVNTRGEDQATRNTTVMNIGAGCVYKSYNSVIGYPGETIQFDGVCYVFSSYMEPDSTTIGATGTLYFSGSFYQGTLTNNGTYINYNSAGQISYAPGNSANWNTVPTFANGALDSLAASGVAKSQSQNLFLASPNGSSGLPSFRAIVAADLPSGSVSPLTTKGDLYTFSTVNARLPVGTNGQVLTADSAQTTGIKWATPTTGTVTSVAMTVPTFLSIGGSPITTSGTLAVTLSGTALPQVNGGTGFVTYTTGDTLYASATNVLSKLAIGSSGQVLTVAGGIPSWATLNAITALTGDVVATGPGSVSATIQANVVSNAKLAQMPANTIKGNNTGSTANALDLTVAQVNTLLGDILANGTVAFSADQSMGSHKLTSVTDPTSAQDAATKNYVDSVASGLNPKQAAYAGSTTNIVGTYANGVAGVGATFTVTATGAFTIDGTTPPVLSRILLKDQSSGFQNGVYDLTVAGTTGVSPVLTRSLDYNTAAEMSAGDLIPVINGTVNTLTSWLQTATITTVGTDNLVFVEWTANPASYLLKANNLSDVASKSTSFNNISPMTTNGDIIYGGASGTGTRLGIGSTGNVLTVAGGIPTWAAPATAGTVTSVALAVPATSIFGVSGSPVTSSGTLTLTTTGTSGGIPYFSSTSAISSSALLTANAIVLGGGAASAPVVLGSLGTTTTVLHGNAAGAPTFGAVALATDVSGNLPVTNLNSGSGASSSTFWRGDGTWATPAGGGTGNLNARFVLENATVVYTNINGPHYQFGTQSLTQVYITMFNSGTSGSTVIQVNQYRSGALQGSATASLSASSGNPAGSLANLSGTLSLLAGDIITVDVNSIAGGSPESLCVEY